MSPCRRKPKHRIGAPVKSGDRLRITAQLVSTASGYRLWSDTYDREVDDDPVRDADLDQVGASAHQPEQPEGEFFRYQITSLELIGQ